MKITQVFLSVNDDWRYVEFVEPVVAQWHRVIPGVRVALLWCDHFLPPHSWKSIPGLDVVHVAVNVPDLVNIPTAIIALWARYFFASLISSPGDVSIISDVDMFPLSADYFVNQLLFVPDDAYVHLHANVPAYGRVPSCYHVASAENFRVVLGLEKGSWTESMLKVWASRKQADGWFCDEDFASARMRESHRKFYLPPRRHQFDRIDRDLNYDAEMLSLGAYYDLHAPRPYHEHATKIQSILQAAPGDTTRPSMPCVFESLVYRTL